MGRPSIINYVETVLDDWDIKDDFTATDFAARFNTKYSHYAIASSGFYTFFLTLEKSGKIEIIRSDTNKKNKYRKVKQNASGDK